MIFVPGKTIIPASGQSITNEDKEVLHNVVDRGWYTDFVYCEKFRRKLSELTGKKYVTLTNSGSSASLIAITAVLKLHPEIECVLTGATGFPTTVAPIYQNGKSPTYIDTDPYTLSPNFDEINEVTSYWKCKGKNSLSIFAHNLGFPYNEKRFAGKGFLIADCCDAMGSEIKNESKWRPAGFFADVMTFSFFPAHHITTGEGGAVLTNDPEVAEMVRKLANWGRDCYCNPGQSNTCGIRFDQPKEVRGELPEHFDHKYTFSELGYNLKMTEFQAGLGFSQIHRISTIAEKRWQNFLFLKEGITEIFKEHLFTVSIPEWSNPNPFGFPIAVNSESPITAYELIEYLEEHKIRTRRMFGGNLVRQPGFAGLEYGFVRRTVKYKNLPHLTGSDFILNNMFWIGCHPQLTPEMLDYVLEIFDSFFTEKGL